MLRTLSRGESVIFGRSVCDTTCKKYKENGQRKKDCLKMGHWQAVMKAGLQLWPVGEYIEHDVDRQGPRVKLHMPDPADRHSVYQFHNKLMNLCNMTFAALSEKVVTVSSKAPRRKANARGQKASRAAKEEVPADAALEPGPEASEAAAAAEGVEGAEPAEAASERPVKRKRLRRASCGDAEDEVVAEEDGNGSAASHGRGRRTACKSKASAKASGVEALGYAAF